MSRHILFAIIALAITCGAPSVGRGASIYTIIEYGPSNLNANRYAFVAFTLKDKPSAQQAFASVVDMEHDVWWGPRTFESARTWANTP